MTDLPEEIVEAAAKNVAKLVTNQTWACECSANKGLNCDCGDALQEGDENWDSEDWTRDACRGVARAALSAIPFAELVAALREAEGTCRVLDLNNICCICDADPDEPHDRACPFAVLSHPMVKVMP